MAMAAGKKLGILAGGGMMPCLVAERAEAAGRPVHIVALEGEADRAIERFSHSWVKWGEIGRMLQVLARAGCDELVIIGSVSRPDMSQVRFDVGALRNLPVILGLMVGGDDSVLSRVVRFFEGKGLRVRGAHEIAPDLVAPAGPLGRERPGARDQKDIAKAMAVVRALGALDVGQAAIVSRQHVIAVEAVEGTDAMLERAAKLRQWGDGRGQRRRGVLVKRPKPGQELRVDMPVIGPRTVELAAAAGLKGIAVLAGQVLLAERDVLVARADAAGLFVVGVEEEEAVESTGDRDG